jgi:rubrerythrin
MDRDALAKLFEIAIGREIEAYKFYKDVADRVADSGVKAIFERLAGDEKGHEEALWKFKVDATALMKFKVVPDYKIAEAVELPPVTAEMRPADAIALAMKKELQAAELYRSLADAAADDATARVYASLSQMELGHKHRLESLYVDIGYPEAW